MIRSVALFAKIGSITAYQYPERNDTRSLGSWHYTHILSDLLIYWFSCYIDFGKLHNTFVKA